MTIKLKQFKISFIIIDQNILTESINPFGKFLFQTFMTGKNNKMILISFVLIEYIGTLILLLGY